VGGFPTFQMKAGSLEKPEQFVVVDDSHVPRRFHPQGQAHDDGPGGAGAVIFNSELVKKHATKEDPWALDWTKNNVAGGGAYKLESWQPGRRSSTRATTTGRAASCRRSAAIVQREIPSAGNRRALPRERRRRHQLRDAAQGPSSK
jgi:peptide/nickel transport system substrate-binding protein